MKKTISILLLSVVFVVSIISPAFAGMLQDGDTVIIASGNKSTTLSKVIELYEEYKKEDGWVCYVYVNSSGECMLYQYESESIVFGEDGYVYLPESSLGYRVYYLAYTNFPSNEDHIDGLYLKLRNSGGSGLNGKIGYFAPNVSSLLYVDDEAVIFDGNGDIVFPHPVLLPELVMEIQGVESQRLHQEVVGVMMTLILCGVSCLALLIILKLFGRVLHRFLA